MRATFRALYAGIATFVALLAPFTSYAHSPGQSYVFLDVTPEGISGRIELPLDALERATGDLALAPLLDGDVNPDALEAYLRRRFAIGIDGEPLHIEFAKPEVFEIEIATFAVSTFAVTTPTPVPDFIDVHYSLIVHALPEHRGGLVIENNFKTGVTDNHSQLSYFFAQARTDYRLNLLGEPLWQRVWNWIREGIIHIWIGFDHVLFLVSLLITAVVVRRDGRWEPESRFRESLLRTIGVVTVFTIAHSLTLALAIKGWVTLPGRFVESVIALSVLAIAIDNLKPMFGRRRWPVIFVFGLFHGLGFASVLEELALNFESKLISLVGFNIGVEIGQIVIALVLFPILFLLRRHNYVAFVLRPASIVIAAIALWWLITRVFNLETTLTSF